LTIFLRALLSHAYLDASTTCFGIRYVWFECSFTITLAQAKIWICIRLHYIQQN
jgi:hypothetical protein